MFSSILRFAAVSLIISSSTYLQAAPDISNLANCINEVRKAESSAPAVPNFDPYKKNYSKLLADLEKAKDSLPHVYQEAAAKPLIAFLQNLGETEFLRIFKGAPTDENSAVLQEILPDAVLGVLFHESVFTIGVNAFQEIASDLYDSFLSDEARVSRQSGNSPSNNSALKKSNAC